MGLFKAAVVDDPVLGRLERARGQWRGVLSLPGHDHKVPLSLYGSGREPDPGALEQARPIASAYAGWRPQLEQALFDHFTPYAEAAAEWEPATATMSVPPIRTPEQVWRHVRLQSIAIIKLGGKSTAELVYAADWDEEHLLGARCQSGRLIELCGSV